jgi:hypothetical protein
MWRRHMAILCKDNKATFTIFLFPVAYRLDVRDARSWGACYPFTLVLLVINVGPVSAYCKLFPHGLLWVRNIVPDRKPLESNKGGGGINELQTLRKCMVNFCNAYQKILSNTMHSAVSRQGTNLNLLHIQNGATVSCQKIPGSNFNSFQMIQIN